MPERYLIVDQLKLNFEGIFDMNSLFNLIDSWFFEKGYDRNERRNEELTKDDGSKELFIELQPWKKTTDYIRNDIKIRLYVSNLKDVEIMKDNVKLKLNQGKIQMILDGRLSTDYQVRWNDKPFLFFLHIIYDRYVYGRYTQKFISNLTADINDLTTKIKKYLNVYRYEGEFKPQWSA